MTKQIIRYEICQSKVNPDCEPNMEYTSYGLNCMVEGVLIQSIPDISTDYLKVQTLALIFNKAKLSPLHFLDAVEDSLD